MSTTTVQEPAGCQIELRHGDSWLSLSIRLGDEFTAGEVVRLGPDARLAVEGADELSAAYGKANWLSGIASGVFYAYRTLKVPRRIVYLLDFAGRLRSADMPAVADAAACAVAECLHSDALPVDLDGWERPLANLNVNGTKPVDTAN